MRQPSISKLSLKEQRVVVLTEVARLIEQGKFNEAAKTLSITNGFLWYQHQHVRIAGLTFQQLFDRLWRQGS